ncbi:hypothetical protein H074_12342 [Amycolatopsis decaplanina DSM 44594]|uniref:Uncharacterized protein n=1 Tax=Amycolatopsis decaplanina DSM 44594 TaxID=1284240 RepID=M2ZJ18_9PSEU|nr:hypothetical protein H074_12342 [Amycolatopsis decaplanina DSM 44594]
MVVERDDLAVEHGLAAIEHVAEDAESAGEVLVVSAGQPRCFYSARATAPCRRQNTAGLVRQDTVRPGPGSPTTGSGDPARSCAIRVSRSVSLGMSRPERLRDRTERQLRHQVRGDRLFGTV